MAHPSDLTAADLGRLVKSPDGVEWVLAVTNGGAGLVVRARIRSRGVEHTGDLSTAALSECIHRLAQALGVKLQAPPISIEDLAQQSEAELAELEQQAQAAKDAVAEKRAQTKRLNRVLGRSAAARGGGHQRPFDGQPATRVGGQAGGLLARRRCREGARDGSELSRTRAHSARGAEKSEAARARSLQDRRLTPSHTRG